MTVDTITDQVSLPPLAQGLPLLGNALAMRQDLVSFLVRQYRQLGPIFRVRAMNQEFVVLAGPEANAFVTKDGADKFSSHEVWNKFGMEFGADHSMLAVDGEAHARLRKLVKPAYSVGRLLADIPMLVDIAQNVINRLKVGEEIPALYLFRLIVTEQLGRALANYAPGDKLQHMITSIRTSLNVYVTRQTPALMLKSPGYQRARKHYLQMGRDVVAEHRNSARESKDLVDVILAASQDPTYRETLSDEEQITFASLGPFIAGLDTAANECTFMLYELLNHPSILAQCEAVADQIFEQGLPTQEQIRAHSVLHSAMMETLRLHSIAPAVNRTAARDFTFAGHSVRKGQDVILATTVSHFLPELYSDPYTFDVERYNAERKENRQRGAYSPFGIGTHLCLGAGAAEAQIVLVLGTLLHMVRLERVDLRTPLRVRNDPTPTFGYSFRVRVSERRS